MVNYPHKVSSNKRQLTPSQTKNFANRGMSFEKMINSTNDYYLTHGVAVIHKKPTPSKLFVLITLREVEQKLLKLILDKHLQLTTQEFMKDSTSILKLKKRGKKLPSL